MLSTGEKIGHYEIIRLLGQGGMGQVYLAKDDILERQVAIKFLPEEMERDPTTRQRFVREAKSAAALDNPFICKVYETGDCEGKVFITMEFVEGKTLDEKLEEGPFVLRDSLRISLEIVEALDAAHRKGIVHRDLKPSNIMITPQGHAKVMDFGLAKRVLPGGEQELSRTMTQSSITEQGAIAGTISYMSPEQARGEGIDARSDIFAFGIILHEMLTGNHPFSKASAIETLSSILRDPPPQTHIKPKSVNPVIAPIIRKALAKDMSTRYQSAAEIIADLRKAQRDIIGGPGIKRLLPIIGAGVLVVAILVVVALWLVVPHRSPVPEAGPEPISVLIADFQNRTGDPVFDGALEQLVGISLEEAPFISVYERGQALKLGNQLDPSSEGKLTAELAQLISNREGINIVVDAAIEQEEEGFSIQVKAIDPVSSEQITQASRRIKNKSEIGKAVDYLSGKLREGLGETSPESAQALAGETFTVSSLAAMNAYARAQELNYQGKREEAIKWFLKALDHDPNLGRAYASLGVIYNNLQKPEESDKYFDMAMARIDQMSEREKLRTLSTYYLIKKNYPMVIDVLNELEEKFPADISIYANLPFAYFQSRNMDMAAEAGRRSVEFNPKNSLYRYNQIWYEMGAGNFDEAEREIHALLELEPSYVEAYVCLGLLELVRGQTTKAAESYRSLESHGAYGNALATTGYADIAAYEGRLSDAVEILKKGIDFDLENDQRLIAADKYIALAQVYMFTGNKNLAVGAADKAIATIRVAEIMFPAAEIYIQAGQHEKARELAAELSRKIQPAHRAFAKLIGGELSDARGDVSGAIQLYHEAQDLVDMWYGRFLLGCTYLEMEAYSEAYSEFDRCLKRRGEATSVFFIDLPTFRYLDSLDYYIGRALEGMGSPAAKDSYQKFLRIKENADKGIPLVEDCRSRLASL
jgi:tetratricopeptide (TPR) repeat protein/predicted Ser/Thr protein kinase